MTIKIFNLDDWALVDQTQHLHLRLDNPGRKVTIQFNAETSTRVGWMAYGSTDDIFLGTFVGREDVEFRPNGPGVVTVDSDGDVWYYTDDGAQIVANDGNEQKSFVQLLEPRDRAEVLERIIQTQNERHNRLMAAQANDRAAMRARIAALEAEKEAEDGENAGGVANGAEANGGAGGGGDASKTGEGASVPAAK